MFGQPQQSTPFGSPPGGGFGQQNTAPGGFGTPAPSGFGAAPAPSAFGGFGSNAPAPAFGGGGFGTPAPASGFGGGSTFGAAAPAPAFGAPASGGFGAPSSSPFGAPAPAPGATLFGTPAPAPSGFGTNTSLFGSSPAPAVGGFGGGFGSSPAPAPGGFGSTSGGFGSTSGGFGSTANTTPAFGSMSGTSAFGTSPAPSGGMFGAPAPAPSTGFGSTGFGGTTTGAFGAPAPSTGAFGAPVGGMGGANVGAGGTKGTPFQPTQRQDGTSHITLHSITAMQPYQTKSFEELRFEDYSQGNKGTGGAAQPGATGGFGNFGSPAPAGGTGLFGSSAPSTGAFGASAPSSSSFGGFGSSPAPAPFGSSAPAPGAFGAPAPSSFGSTSSAFGSKPPATPGLFGTPAPAPGGSLFGPSAPAPSTGLFGASAPAPFGAPAPAPTGLFGAPAPAPFGAPAPAPTSVFGAPSPGAFGAPSPAPSAFGTPPPGGFGGFGTAPAPGGFGGFGNSPAPASTFGAPAPGGFGGFGASSFGAKPPGSTGLFGQPSPAPGGNLFGQPQAPAPAFGAPPAAPVMAVAPPVGSIIPPAANDILASQLAALESKQKEMEEKDSFKSKSSPSAAITAASRSERDYGSFGPITPGRLTFPTRRSSPSSSAKIRPRGFASPPSDSSSTGIPKSLSKLGSTAKPMSGPESAATLASTRLIVAPTPKPKLKLVLGNDEEKKESSTPSLANNSGSNDIRVGEVIGQDRLSKLSGAFSSPPPVTTPRNQPGASTPKSARSTFTPSKAEVFYHESTMATAGRNTEMPTPSSGVDNDAAPKLSRDDYKCSPSIATLQSMNPADLAAVENFVVERSGVGSIAWEGAVDVRHADLDKMVLIEPGAVSVYTEEEKSGTKPHVGTKLNRPAVLTMNGIFPPEGSNTETIEKFKRRVAKQTMKMDAELVDYDSSTGVWKLKVKHFSRYAFDPNDDSDDDDEQVEMTPSLDDELPPLKRKVDFRLGERGGRSPEQTKGAMKKPREDTPYKPRKESPRDDEDEMSCDVVVEDEPEKVYVDAEEAYNSWWSDLNRESAAIPHEANTELRVFSEEAIPLKDTSDAVAIENYRPSTEDIQHASCGMSSITSKLCQDALPNFQKTSSSFEFGNRMGKSFRPGWGPDGSFLSLSRNGTIIRSRPKFEQVGVFEDDKKMLVANHSIRKHSLKKSDSSRCPIHCASEVMAGTALAKYIGHITSRSSTAKNAFLLLKVVQETQSSNSSNQESDSEIDLRCVFAFTNMLTSSCSADVRDELDAQDNAYNLKSLLAVVSSGDLGFAAKVASELGFIRLSILLSSGPASRRSIMKDTTAWKTAPEDLKKCYRIIAGDLPTDSSEHGWTKDIGWKRCMAMQLAYATEKPRDIRSFVQEYERKVSEGNAPFPAANYIGAQETSSESVLFKLLKLSCKKNNLMTDELSNFIDPLGYSANPHDFALAFHLAYTVSAMPDQPRLASENEQNLIDGYVAQLVSKGMWYWGVYVLLCSMTKEDVDLIYPYRIRMTKTLISQHYKPSHVEQRSFLESIGVPSYYFEEGLGLLHKNAGHTFPYVTHTLEAGKIEEARSVFEETLLPSSLFVNDAKFTALLKMADQFGVGEDNLSAVLPDLFRVSDSIQKLGNMTSKEIDTTLPQLFQLLDRSEKTLLLRQATERRREGNGFALFHEDFRIPLGSFILQCLNDLTHLRLQVLAVQEGMSSSSTTYKLMEVAREKYGPDTADNYQRYLL